MDETSPGSPQYYESTITYILSFGLDKALGAQQSVAVPRTTWQNWYPITVGFMAIIVYKYRN
jgi:hypothetical protein